MTLSLVAAAHAEYQEHDYVSLVSGTNTRDRYARYDDAYYNDRHYDRYDHGWDSYGSYGERYPYSEEYSDGYIRSFQSHDYYGDNDQGFLYSYSYPKIYPRVPDYLRSQPNPRPVQVIEYTGQRIQRPPQARYWFSSGYYEKGYQQVHRSFLVGDVLPEDRAYSDRSHRIYDNGPRLDIG